MTKNVNYQFQSGKELSYSDYSLWGNTLNLTWGKVLWSDVMGGVRSPDITYTVIVAKSKRFRLDSMCALRQN